MVGIFALLNGDPRSDFSMRCCDLQHNHSCQLAHYGFCPKPLSDVRRALFSLLCLMKDKSLSLPWAHQGKSRAKPSYDWRKLLADFVFTVNKDLTLHFPPFQSTISWLAARILRQYGRSTCLPRSTFIEGQKERGLKKRGGIGHKDKVYRKFLLTWPTVVKDCTTEELH